MNVRSYAASSSTIVRKPLSARLVPVALLAAMCTACNRQDTLRPVESIAISEAPLSNLLREDGRKLWLSDGRHTVRLDPDAGIARRADIGAPRDARVLGEADGRLILLTGETVLALSPDSLAPDTLLRGVETAHLASAARGVLVQSIRLGEIVISPLPDLRPAWGWADEGAATTAIAVSPEGDRIYQALDRTEEGAGPRVLIRDLLSGRTVGEIESDAPFRALVATASGDLLGVTWEDGRSSALVERLVWVDGALRRAWGTSVRAPASVQGLALAITADGRRVAVVGGNEEAGLTLLDGETGSIIADFDALTRDAVFDERGRLYAVTDSVILRF